MGDTGDDFKAFNEHKKEQRAKIEPNRKNYAMRQLGKLGLAALDHGDSILIRIEPSTITFWPFTGWFQGQRPLGGIKGRGIKPLLKQLNYLIERNKSNGK